MILGSPPLSEQVNNAGVMSISWSNFITNIYRVVLNQVESGTTAQRPTKNLYIGRRYFDTSLGAKGKPIWVDKTGIAWIDASGANV